MKHYSKIKIQDFALWDKKAADSRSLYSFQLELTARCNLNCRHCYINLPANDKNAQSNELGINEIENIADQAIELGAVWVLLTGGEPLLRHDFPEIFIMLKRKGLLVSVFTNATLITPTHIDLFKKYPPRDVETTIYGVSEKTFESITRVPNSHKGFIRGLNRLAEANIPIRLKAMALRSNLHEIDSIASYGKKFTKDFYRFDPVLHLRYDQNDSRNNEIKSERLTPDEIIKLEHADRARFEAMVKNKSKYINEWSTQKQDNHLFQCGAGVHDFIIGYDGTFRLCSSLWAPNCTRSLRQYNLIETWNNFVPAIRDLRTENQAYINSCVKCPIKNLCLSCPAHAHLETGVLDEMVPYFCEVAHARAKALQEGLNSE